MKGYRPTPTLEEIAILHIAEPIDRGSTRGLYFPVCRVCGRDHHHEATYSPSQTSPEEWRETIIANESCDTCYSWLADVEGAANPVEVL